MASSDVTVGSINEMLEREFPDSAGRCVGLGTDYALATQTVSQAARRPGGYVSGPTQFALFDAAFWYATFVAIERIEPMALTAELSIRYLRPAIGEVLHCRAKIESVNRRSVIMSGHLWCDDRAARPTSIAQCTYAIPLPRS